MGIRHAKPETLRSVPLTKLERRKQTSAKISLFLLFMTLLSAVYDTLVYVTAVYDTAVYVTVVYVIIFCGICLVNF
ncbi:hypothetical protein Tco_1435738 [Tanacetum coccineum]